MRASTPTAAARLVVPDATDLRRQVERGRAGLERGVRTTLERARTRSTHAHERLRRAPALAVERKRARLEHAAGRLRASHVQLVCVVEVRRVVGTRRPRSRPEADAKQRPRKRGDAVDQRRGCDAQGEVRRGRQSEARATILDPRLEQAEELPVELVDLVELV